MVGDRGGSARETGSFLVLGIEHILTGYDHLLFLFGLLLPGGGLLSLAKIINAFTIAHSVTLSLAVLQVISLPDRLIEAVIALSIAFVAAENLFRSLSVSRRWLVSLCFGLVHGFGFSSALRALDPPPTVCSSRSSASTSASRWARVWCGGMFASVAAPPPNGVGEPCGPRLLPGDLPRRARLVHRARASLV